MSSAEPKVTLLSFTQNPIATLYAVEKLAKSNSQNPYLVNVNVIQKVLDLAKIFKQVSVCTKTDMKDMWRGDIEDIENDPDFKALGFKDIFEYEKEVRNWVEKVVNMAIPIAEFINFSFLLENVSIAFREQLVRHRTNSYWIQSGRSASDYGTFVDEKRYHLPDNIIKAGLETEYTKVLHAQQEFIRFARESGVPDEDTREVIGVGVLHRLSMQINLRSLIELLKHRKCLTGDTKIPLLTGEDKAIKDIPIGVPFWVYSIEPGTKEITTGLATNLGVTKRNAQLVEIVLDSGESFKCTPDHQIMLRDGSFVEAGKLNMGQSLMPYIKKIHENKTINYTVKEINFLDFTEDVYDLSVEGTHNFAISAGVFVHNCHIAQAHWTPVVMGIVEELGKIDPLFANMGKPPCYSNGVFTKCAYQGIAEERYGKIENGEYHSKDKGPICPLFHASLPKEQKLDLRLVPEGKVDKDLNAKFSKLWNFDKNKEKK